MYQTWWELTEGCSERSGEFRAVTWYRVPDGPWTLEIDGDPVDGYWEPLHNRIVVKEGTIRDGNCRAVGVIGRRWSACELQLSHRRRGATRYYNVRADAPEVTWFKPGEAKQFIFDLRNSLWSLSL
jgi:hypothetical protein